MKYGKFLPDQGTIGFVAPSFGCNIEPYYTCFKNAKKIWTNMGFHISEGPNVYEGRGIGISNTPEKCAEEFMEWYQSSDNDLLISCGGGELMCEILPHLDFEALANSAPKWFMGYSDNTNLIFLLTTLCDIAAVYGPCAAAFGMNPWHQSLHDAMSILQGKTQTVTGYDLWEKEGLKSEENPLEPYHVTEKRILHSYPSSSCEMEGRLAGGCLDSLSILCGTKFDRVKEFSNKYKEDGILWFFEACDLNVMSIRRALWQLSEAGWFEHVKGFLIGRPLCYGEELMGLDQYKAVTDILAPYQVPIIMDIDIGHLPPMMPLVSGSKAKVTVKDNDIAISMEYC